MPMRLLANPFETTILIGRVHLPTTRPEHDAIMRLPSWFVVVAALATARTAASAQTAPEPARILIVYQYDPKAPGVVAFSAQLRRMVQAGVPRRAVFYNEALDLDRFDDPDRVPQLARYFTEKYQGKKLDAIVTGGSLALKFTTERLRTLFPNVPVVYGLAFEPVVNFDALPPNVTGSRQPLPFDSTFRLARSLTPDAQRIVVVAGASTMDSVLRSAAIRQITPLLDGMELDVLENWTFDALLDSLRQVPPRTIVILSALNQDQRGYEFNTGDVIPTVARVASVPLYGIARNWVGEGIVGGSVMNFADDGVRTGQLLVRVLRRAPGEPMPAPEIAASSMVVDWRQLQRWGLPENRLPPNTEILFRTQTLWERHWLTILGVLALLVVQSLLIARLLLERRQRVRAQRAVERQTEYERMIAGLTADAVRVAPEEAPRALEDALARMGRFSGASAGVLIVSSDSQRPPIRLFWSKVGEQFDREVSSVSGQIAEMQDSRLEIPLVAEQTRYGVLELFRADRQQWSAATVARLEAAGDLIANALAREKAAQELEQIRGQIAHMARVATVGELAAAVAHELRQPLAAIRANAEAAAMLLQQKTPDIADTREILQDIIRDNRRAAEVIDHIGLLVRRQALASTTVDLNAVCQHTAQLLDRDVRARGALVKLSLHPSLHPIKGDPVQLQQVVMNLVLNALDASTLSARGCEIIVGTDGSDSQSEVFVHDAGPGLPPALLEKVFEPFFTTKLHGLGMGLTIVRTIVEQHHGRVHVENVRSGGAIFRVTFPIIDATRNSQPADAREQSLSAPQTSR